MEIKMVDLHRQYLDIKTDIDMAMQTVINNNAFIKGPQVKEFEKALSHYLNVKHVIACANGTDALQLALMALGLRPGDEVITPDFTFISTVEVVALLGLKPVIVDVDPDTFMIDPDEVRKSITDKTKVIIPVHLFGQCTNMEAINKLAKEFNLFVIEDTAQALGSDYYLPDVKQKAGTIGNIGTTSFFPSKNLGCYGDGGAVFTNNDQLAENIRLYGNHGMKEKYRYEKVGINSRLDTIQAAVLLQKLPLLDKYNKARAEAAKFYDKHLGILSKHIQTPVKTTYSSHIYHQYTLIIKDGTRDALRSYLQERQVPSMIYYPYPLHGEKAFQTFINPDQSYSNSNNLSEQVLSLPMHTHLSVEELTYICDQIISFYNE